MIVSGYTLELYCDNDDVHPNGFFSETSCEKFPVEFTAEGKDCYSVVRRMAKNAGWKLKRNGECICPMCNNKKNK